MTLPSNFFSGSIKEIIDASNENMECFNEAAIENLIKDSAILQKHKEWLYQKYDEVRGQIRVESSYTKRAQLSTAETFFKMVIDNLEGIK